MSSMFFRGWTGRRQTEIHAHQCTHLLYTGDLAGNQSITEHCKELHFQVGLTNPTGLLGIYNASATGSCYRTVALCEFRLTGRHFEILWVFHVVVHSFLDAVIRNSCINNTEQLKQTTRKKASDSTFIGASSLSKETLRYLSCVNMITVYNHRYVAKPK